MSSSNELVYERLREAIIYGEYPPGAPLGEVELSERYQVSRTPVREALRRLAGEGLVAKRRRGLAVKTYSRAEISEVYDLRALLESYAASLAAKRASSKQIVRLRELNDQYEAAVHVVLAHTGEEGRIQRIKAIIEANTLFHDALLSCAGNGRLAFLASKVVVVPLVFRSFYWGDEHALLTSCRAHKIIIDAVEGGDTGRANSAMCEHIYVGRDHVLEHLGPDEA